MDNVKPQTLVDTLTLVAPIVSRVDEITKRVDTLTETGYTHSQEYRELTQERYDLVMQLDTDERFADTNLTPEGVVVVNAVWWEYNKFVS
jgi:hypothetical protein